MRARFPTKHLLQFHGENDFFIVVSQFRLPSGGNRNPFRQHVIEALSFTPAQLSPQGFVQHRWGYIAPALAAQQSRCEPSCVLEKRFSVSRWPGGAVMAVHPAEPLSQLLVERSPWQRVEAACLMQSVQEQGLALLSTGCALGCPA
jgi:hypothetical protein